MRPITVAVFEHQRKRGIQLATYTRWFNPEWQGCCLHLVMALNGTEAKKLAAAEHRVKCMTKKETV